MTLRLKALGLAEFNIPEALGTIIIKGQLLKILGIIGRQAITGKYVGDRPVQLIVHKLLYIYLDQLSTTSNIVDGAPSTLLAIIPAATSDGIIDITPSTPIYKKTRSGTYRSIKPARVR